MRGAVPPLPHYVFMAWCLVKHRDNFTFTFFMRGRSGSMCKVMIVTRSGLCTEGLRKITKELSQEIQSFYERPASRLQK
jgi:hypothetical protein